MKYKRKYEVFIDTSGFKAFIDSKDSHHKKAKKIFKQLKKSCCKLITSNYILDESYTLIRQRRGVQIATQLQKILAQSSAVIYVVRVTVADEQRAWAWFKRDWRNLSFTDCVSFALMERLGIQSVVTFDEHFSWAGFLIEK